MTRKIGKTKKPLFSRVSSSASSSESSMASSNNSSTVSSTTSSNSSSESTTLRDEIEMRTIKMIDVGYVAILYFVFGIVISVFFDKILGTWSKEKDDKKNLALVGAELVGIMWLFGIATYIVRNIVEIIPSPLSYVPLSNPKRKFRHTELKELTTATVFTIILLGLSKHFRDKLEYFYERFSQKVKEEYNLRI